MSLPLCLDEGAARGLAQALLYQAVAEREQVAMVLPPSALALDPGDVISLSLDGRATDYRLTRLGLEAGRPASGLRADSGVFAYRDGAGSARAPSPPTTAGVGLLQILDLPLLAPEATAHAPYLAAYTQPWSPVAVLRGRAGGPVEEDAVLGARSVIGRLAADLHSGPCGRWDRVTALHVEVPPGAELASAPERAVLDGANAAAVLTPSGEWEVLQWASAALLAPGRYRLTGLLRGQLGTEFARGSPTPAGAPFVVLTEALVQSRLPLAERGLPVSFRWGPLGEPPDAPSYTGADLVVRGVGLRPYAPVQARLLRQDNGDLLLTWIRRTRLNGDAWEQDEVPLAEEREAYAVEILNGSALQRSREVTEPRLTYTAAEQATDFGAPVTRLSVAIHQLSAAYGRGPALRTTLQL